MDFTRIIIDIVDGQIEAIYADETIDCYVCFRNKSDPDIFKGPVAPDKILEDPCFLYVMPEIARMNFEDSRGKFVERIHGDKAKPESWMCNCGNISDGSGFKTCLPHGKEVEHSFSGWKKHYKCASCGRIIEQETLEVIGWAPLNSNSRK